MLDVGNVTVVFNLAFSAAAAATFAFSASACLHRQILELNQVQNENINKLLNLGKFFLIFLLFLSGQQTLLFFLLYAKWK